MNINKHSETPFLSISRRPIDRNERIRLLKDIPSHSLITGDEGTAVHIYPDGTVEVEFLAGGVVSQVITLDEDAVEICHAP